jgi:predicted RNA-binding Zn-ribbon protein involved in translation (DUF1610 family)
MSVSALVWAKPDTVTALQREADAVKWQRSYIRWFCPTCGEWGIFEDAQASARMTAHANWRR